MGITRQQALDCFASDDLIGIGMEADALRRTLHPEGVVSYTIDRMFDCSTPDLDAAYAGAHKSITMGATGLLVNAGPQQPVTLAHYETLFTEYLGAPNVIWLNKGIVGDDTHGHVDDLSRFVNPTTVVTVVESNPKDANHKPLRENLRRLRAARDQDGNPLNVVELPMPRPVIFEKRRLPASYANFYIANGIVLVPVFNDANDRIALNTLADLFPSHEIVPIYSGDLVWGLGTMHCMTQQQPA